MNKPSHSNHSWAVRVRWLRESESQVYARNNQFTVGRPASFRQTDPHPTAIEYLLGALGADITNGFQTHAAQKGVQIDAIEMALSGRLDNPLVFLGVIGEEGSPALKEITGTFYISADATEETLQAIWATTLERSPLANTLKHTAAISIDLRKVD